MGWAGEEKWMWIEGYEGKKAKRVSDGDRGEVGRGKGEERTANNFEFIFSRKIISQNSFPHSFIYFKSHL